MAEATCEKCGEPEFHERKCVRHFLMAERGADGRYHHGDLRLTGQRLAGITLKDVTVDGWAFFDGCTFTGYVSFVDCVFTGPVHFANSTWEWLVFSGCRFEDEAMLDVDRAVHLTIRETEFGEAKELWLPQADVRLQRVTFASGVRLVGAPHRLSLTEVVFRGGASLSLDSTVVALFDVEFGAASTFGRLEASSAPRLLRLWGTNLSHLSVVSADLRFCSFAGARGLDGFGVDSLSAFSWSPRGLHARRRVLWDEAVLREPDCEGWQNLVHWDESEHLRTGESLGEVLAESRYESPIEEAGYAVEVAAMYRALRKAREDAKDEPGAADFYYGEMEMRRMGRRMELVDAARRRAWGEWVNAAAEHTLLWLYWAVSGYGLRAWRALTALIIVVLGASIIFRYGGFPGDTHTYAASLRFAVQSAISLVRGTAEPLTPTGEWVALALRLLGPLLFGLALLALRGRVRR